MAALHVIRHREVEQTTRQHRRSHDATVDHMQPGVPVLGSVGEHGAKAHRARVCGSPRFREEPLPEAGVDPVRCDQEVEAAALTRRQLHLDPIVACNHGAVAVANQQFGAVFARGSLHDRRQHRPVDRDVHRQSPIIVENCRGHGPPAPAAVVHGCRPRASRSDGASAPDHLLEDAEFLEGVDRPVLECNRRTGRLFLTLDDRNADAAAAQCNRRAEPRDPAADDKDIAHYATVW